MQGCATSAANLVNSGTSVETLLRNAFGTQSCYALLDDVLREQGANPTAELPRARTQILNIAKPALQDEPISVTAKLIKAFR